MRPPQLEAVNLPRVVLDMTALFARMFLATSVVASKLETKADRERDPVYPSS
jgi:hypothetical protein